jgi:hypothetical protein
MILELLLAHAPVAFDLQDLVHEGEFHFKVHHGELD